MRFDCVAILCSEFNLIVDYEGDGDKFQVPEYCAKEMLEWLKGSEEQRRMTSVARQVQKILYERCYAAASNVHRPYLLQSVYKYPAFDKVLEVAVP